LEFFQDIVKDHPRSVDLWVKTLNLFLKPRVNEYQSVWNTVRMIDLSYFGGELEKIESQEIKNKTDMIVPQQYISDISQSPYLIQAEVKFGIYATLLYAKKLRMVISTSETENIYDCIIKKLFYLKSAPRKSEFRYIPTDIHPTPLVLKEYKNVETLDLTSNDTVKNEDLNTGLVSLNLTNNHMITNVGLEHLQNLTSLNLMYNTTITDIGLSVVPNLLELDLESNSTVTDSGLNKLTKLVSLNLTDNDTITDKGVENLKNLTSLDLTDNNTITNRALSNLIKLNSLYLATNRSITEVGLSMLTNLTLLDLDDNLTFRGSSRGGLKDLTSLSLAYNSVITDKFVGRLTNLTSLDLNENDTITNNGLKPLVNLNMLSLYGNNKITNSGLKTLKKLIILDLTYNYKITPAGLKPLENLYNVIKEPNYTNRDLWIGSTDAIISERPDVGL